MSGKSVSVEIYGGGRGNEGCDGGNEIYNSPVLICQNVAQSWSQPSISQCCVQLRTSSPRSATGSDPTPVGSGVWITWSEKQ